MSLAARKLRYVDNTLSPYLDECGESVERLFLACATYVMGLRKPIYLGDSYTNSCRCITKTGWSAADASIILIRCTTP